MECENDDYILTTRKLWGKLGWIRSWLITLAYYRSSTLMKWVISLAPFVLFALLKVANARSGGAIFEVLGQFTRASMRTPYMAGFTMLVYSVIGCALFYLLIRRAPLKD